MYRFGMCLLIVSATIACGQQPRSVTAPRQAEPATVASAASLCQRVEADPTTPVGCSTDYVDGVLSMMIRFGDAEQVASHMQPMASDVAEPFCAAANQQGRQARVYMTVGRERARFWDCELSRWSAWFPLQGGEAARAAADASEERSVLAEAVGTCQRVQRNAELPVSCETQESDDVQTMIVGFRDEQAADRLMSAVIDQVTAPFCEGAAHGERSAVVYFVFYAAQRGRGFDCNTSQWGAWFAVPNDGPETSPARATTSL